MNLAIYHNLPPGGAKRASHEFIKHLSRNNSIDMYLIDSSSEDFLNSEKNINNLYISETDANGFALKGIMKIYTSFKIKYLQKKLASLIDAKNYDAVIVLQCKVNNSPYILKFLKTQHIFYCHEPASKIFEPHYVNRSGHKTIEFFKNLLKKYFVYIDRENVRNTEFLLTSSKYNCEVLYKDYGIHPKLNYVGVDADKFKPLNIDKQEYILCVGALNKAKGQDFLIRSIGMLEKKYPVKFIYSYSYGLSNYKKYLENLANELGVEIYFDNLVDDIDLVRSYNEAYITAFPSLLEPLGLVVLESMSCETPVIGVEEAGPRETIISNETGLLTARDEGEFAIAIKKLMTDDNLRKRMGKKGRQNIQDYWTWQKLGRNFEKNIYKCIYKDNS